MNISFNPSREKWGELLARPKQDESDLRATCEAVFKAVEERGDEALREFTSKFDGVDVVDFLVTDEEFARAETAISQELKTAIKTAAANIEAFHRAQMPAKIEWSNGEGVTCRQEPRPIRRVGLYVPGGSAPLFSTVLMLAIPARLAGCGEVVLCSPPEINPAILWTARLCGVTKIFKVGGAQAIAAMTLGTASVPHVDKIFGPGNRYVMAAKQLATTRGAAIDMPAGPSEVMVVADGSAVPAFVAADMLSQAEHGADSQAITLTWEPSLACEIKAELKRQLRALPRRSTAEKALRESRLIVVSSRNEAVEMVNEYAPEHLILSVENSEDFAAKVVNAGSIFLGNFSPESAGDYASGTNHTLPTAGWARAFSGVNVDSFMKKITIQSITREGLKNLSFTITEMARAEQLDAHANAVIIRLL